MKKIFRIYYEEVIEILGESYDYYSNNSHYTQSKTMLLPYCYEIFSTVEEAEKWMSDNIIHNKEEQFFTILPFYIISKYR